MNIWQVSARGEGFQRNGLIMGFELSGFVVAADASDAFAKALHIAKQDFVELAQAEHPEHPRAVINPEEIQECSGAMSGHELNKINIHWLGGHEA